ncbi:WapI family immunity protein [Dactylosporangium sp. CS-033363]|uniref:WapI family immunity protein n=1 Tax=Dactylosporangium sp. CS-033363 TaxID=3239935 RepID=UPI003D8A57A1
MRLQTRTGAFVELRAVKSADQPLFVEGVVDALDGRAWSFRAPALSPEEAKDLGNWLLKAAKGRIEPQERLAFADLSFTFDEHEVGQPRLVVGFSRTTAPAWLGDEQSMTFDYPVTLDLTTEALEAAAVDWERELRRRR